MGHSVARLVRARRTRLYRLRRRWAVDGWCPSQSRTASSCSTRSKRQCIPEVFNMLLQIFDEGHLTGSPCTRSTLGVSFIRDTRIGLPFPVAGTMVSVSAEQNGGPIGGDADYQKLNIDTRWFAPLGTIGAKKGSIGGGIQFARLHRQVRLHLWQYRLVRRALHSMGGVQYGIHCAATMSSRSRLADSTPTHRREARRSRRSARRMRRSPRSSAPAFRRRSTSMPSSTPGTCWTAAQYDPVQLFAASASAPR